MELRIARIIKLSLVFVLLAGLVPATARNVVAADTTSTVPYLQNGSFENVSGGVIANWSAVQTRIDLGGDSGLGGVTSVLGGCPSVDTTDYAGIWTRDAALVGTRPTHNAGNGPKPLNDNDALDSIYSVVSG
jgi:hypothetical protein